MTQEQVAITFGAQTQQVSAQAYMLGQRLDMRALRHYDAIRKSPLMVAVGQGYAVLFRYGAVVFFGVAEKERNDFLAEIKEFVTQPYDTLEVEEATLTCDAKDTDKVSFDAVHLKQWDVSRLLVIADVLAKSQILSHHEARVSQTFDRIEPIAQEMQAKGYPSGKRTRDLLRHIALTLSAQRTITGQAEILDKPDFLWDQPPEMEGFFVKLEDEYEIRERYDALKEKLDLIFRTSEMMLGLMNSRHTLHVEWYIVILIIIDIAIHLLETYVF